MPNNTDPDDGADTAPDNDATTGNSANREAANYRRRLRDTEAERDELRGQLDAANTQLDTLRTREAERLAETALVDGTDLWRGDGITLADLLADDGTVDPAKVDAAAKQLADTRPHYRRGGNMPPDPDQGKGDTGKGAPSFAEFLRSARAAS